MTNITLYVPPKDKPIWKEAQRYLKFYRDQSLSAYLTEHLTHYVAAQKAKHSPPAPRSKGKPSH